MSTIMGSAAFFFHLPQRRVSEIIIFRWDFGISLSAAAVKICIYENFSGGMILWKADGAA